VTAWTLITNSTLSNDPPIPNASRNSQNEANRSSQPAACQAATWRR
jgi:hypothetical protein